MWVKPVGSWPQQNTTKSELCGYFWGFHLPSPSFRRLKLICKGLTIPYAFTRIIFWSVWYQFLCSFRWTHLTINQRCYAWHWTTNHYLNQICPSQSLSLCLSVSLSLYIHVYIYISIIDWILFFHRALFIIYIYIYIYISRINRARWINKIQWTLWRIYELFSVTYTCNTARALSSDGYTLWDLDSPPAHSQFEEREALYPSVKQSSHGRSKVAKTS